MYRIRCQTCETSHKTGQEELILGWGGGQQPDNKQIVHIFKVLCKVWPKFMSALGIEQRSSIRNEIKVSFISPGSSGCCEILSGIPARGGLWRCENISWPCALWTTCLQPIRQIRQQQAATLCPKTDAHPIGGLPERLPECQSFNLGPACVPPANSCISGLLRLHIACDLMAGCGQQLWGKEGGVREPLCVVFSSTESVLAGVRVGVRVLRVNVGKG